VTGADLHPHLKIWHGVTPALWMSMIAIVGGAVLLTLHGPLDKAWIAAAAAGGQGDLRPARRRAGRADPGDHRDQPQRRDQPLPRDLHAHGVALGWIAYSGSGLSAPTRGLLPVAPVIAVGWLMLIVATVSVVTCTTTGSARWC
jgi:multicomponent K+:H+ antiporter subunit A